MTGEEIGSSTDGRPASARLEKWVDSVGNTTLPVLAGFSTASVVIVSDDAENFRWPGWTILTLAISAVMLILAIQCGYHARIYLSERSDRKDGKKSPPLYENGRFWTFATRWIYDIGIVALLAGLGLAVAPHHATGTQASLQCFAAGLAFAAGIVQIVWIVLDTWVWHFLR